MNNEQKFIHEYYKHLISLESTKKIKAGIDTIPNNLYFYISLSLYTYGRSLMIFKTNTNNSVLNVLYSFCECNFPDCYFNSNSIKKINDIQNMIIYQPEYFIFPNQIYK